MNRRQPNKIKSLKIIIGDILSGMSDDLVPKIARQVKKRAVHCVQENGGILNN